MELIEIKRADASALIRSADDPKLARGACRR
jgi:hypothetical protein